MSRSCGKIIKNYKEYCVLRGNINSGERWVVTTEHLQMHSYMQYS